MVGIYHWAAASFFSNFESQALGAPFYKQQWTTRTGMQFFNHCEYHNIAPGN